MICYQMTPVRALMLFADGRAVDQVVTFPPPLIREVVTASRRCRFRLIGGSWKPQHQSQLAMYREVTPRKHLSAHKSVREILAEDSAAFATTREEFARLILELELRQWDTFDPTDFNKPL